ncbi:MAG TPA: hypothetical protein VF658_00425 [Pyrinomonadaceae bacterium]|jgi:hypothetical protein
MRLTALSLLLVAVLGFSVSQTMAQQTATGDEVTKENWQQHPKITAVRAIVETVKDGLSKKSFRTRTRKFEYCEPYEDSQRTLAIDGRGRVRYYEKQGGSEDSSLKLEHYYDESGRLRFVFITGGATNGSELEHRIYFDEGGKRIYEEQKYTKGEGYTFSTVWPAEQLNIKDVSTTFAAKSRCPEIKSKKVKGRRQK